jgi:hypothetical protein
MTILFKDVRPGKLVTTPEGHWLGIVTGWKEYLQSYSKNKMFLVLWLLDEEGNFLPRRNVRYWYGDHNDLKVVS